MNVAVNYKDGDDFLTLSAHISNLEDDWSAEHAEDFNATIGQLKNFLIFYAKPGASVNVDWTE